MLCAEMILEYYPANPAFFRYLETLAEDMRNSDADRVSRVIGHNKAQLDGLLQTFSVMVKDIWEEKDRARQSVILDHMERLAVEWGTCEARIEMVTLWFRARWGMEAVRW
ncbi:hypothetical protein L873DRAFT_1801159 [Choiromyces venosus 120613-1]|uniref:Uncharacterized protein n=1 Tax=Choiromyces venosus 120613-1 TaxID=1336337 RepID=A0A3N4JXI9_9PEZI|nr:hypothetical protein L873DRAFT_1801159 [Choiromyces venosus 120613-1]